MRLVLIAIVGILLLGGGAGGAYFYFKAPAVASTGDTAKKADVSHSNEHSDGTHHEFVELQPLILPIIDEDGVSQVVSVVVVIEVEDKSKAEKIEKYSPRLKDAYIQDMYGILNKRAALQGGVIQVKVLKERLRRISDHVMGDDVIHDVLLQVVQQRRI